MASFHIIAKNYLIVHLCHNFFISKTILTPLPGSKEQKSVVKIFKVFI